MYVKTLNDQKNGWKWKNVCIFHFANGKDMTLFMQHIRQHSKDPEEKLLAYFVNGVRYITESTVKSGNGWELQSRYINISGFSSGYGRSPCYRDYNYVYVFSVWCTEVFEEM